MRRTLALIASAVLGALLVASPAAAHDQLVGTVPADGARGAAPGRVEFRFDDVVLNRYGQLAVTGPDGRRYDRGAPQVVDNTIATDLAPLPRTGVYTAAYRIVSADGHPVSGEIRFTVTAVTPGASAAPREPVPPSPAVTTGRGGSPLPYLAGGAAAIVLLAAGTEVVRRRRGAP
jgi:methionine-rich copper-binding protein CopC